MTDADLADLQAQLMALRVAVEGAWLSLLTTAPDPVGDAQTLGMQHVAALGRLEATTADARAVREAVVRHTEQLWGSIAWQLANRAEKGDTA